MSQKEVTRRAFLTRTSALGLVAIGSSAILSACGGGDKSGDSATTAETPAAGAEASAAAEAPDAPDASEAVAEGCGDVSGLTDAEVQMRETLAYVDESSVADKTCLNCQLYEDAAAGSACGGCKVIKGPIAPGGYCNSWAAKLS